METKQEMQEILTKLEAHNRQQLLFTKILCVLCALAVICSLVVMIAVSKTASALNEMAAPMQELAVQAEAVMTDLGTAAKELAKADLGSMVNQIEALTRDSQLAVAQAVEKMDTIDIEALNKAIKDLAAIVEPLAKVSNFFR